MRGQRCGAASPGLGVARTDHFVRLLISLVDIEFGPDGTFQLRHEKPNYIFLTPFVCYSQKRERIKGQKQRLGY